MPRRMKERKGVWFPTPGPAGAEFPLARNIHAFLVPDPALVCSFTLN